MKSMTVILGLFALLAVAMGCAAYLAFLRPAGVRVGPATIGRRTFSPVHTITRYQASSASRRQTWYSENFTIPDSWVFELQIDGVADPAKFSLEKSAGETFRVGQRVHLKYQERGIPPFWKRVYVLEMKPAD